ncbi:MAG: Phosphoenolpyruvate-dependent phosphotransferase system [Legionellaceae bacterium]
MLDVIRRIVQKVNAAHDFSEALQIIVQSIRKAIATEACSVFLVDEKNKEYVLMATEGLNPIVVEKVRLSYQEGLVGLVGQREEPINLEDAPSHPNYKYFADVGEERFRAFLGVPIIHQRYLFGVLIVQQEEQRKFDEAEEAFLITMSAQLAGVIAHAEAKGIIADLLHPARVKTDSIIEGIPSAFGIGIGNAVVIYPLADLHAVPERKTEDIPAEISFFETALTAASESMRILAEQLGPNLPEEERALFDVYLRILDHTNLGAEVIKEIRKGCWAQGALKRVIKKHIRHFEVMDDDYLRERASDIKDLGLRVLAYLQSPNQAKINYSSQTILVGEEITATALAEVPIGNLVGIVSVRGSVNSHVAILARAMGVPAVLGAEGLPFNELEGREIIIDGYQGRIYLSPSETLYKQYVQLLAQQRALDAELETLRGLPAITPDGYQIGLHVNIGLAADAGAAFSAGAEGVGLYRTEIPFMTRERFPAEEEQRIIYRQVLNAFAPRLVTMRTLDIGGDKALPYFNITEDNPFLGWRGIRVTLDHPEVFLVQARAMLRASTGLNNLRIMLPMISSVVQVDDALRLLKQAYQEVRDEGANIVMPQVGIMIEVPSAVYLARELASRVDFLSVGSNDLTQYILAVDRNNPRVAELYDALHPAVLRALLQVINAAHQINKPVSICGEMTGDPVSVILLLGMGFDTLSLNATSLPRIKWLIRNFCMSKARQLLADVLEMEDPRVIRAYVEKALEVSEVAELISLTKTIEN